MKKEVEEKKPESNLQQTGAEPDEITSDMIENAHASGDGAIKRSDEAITGKEGELPRHKASPEY